LANRKPVAGDLGPATRVAVEALVGIQWPGVEQDAARSHVAREVPGLRLQQQRGAAREKFQGAQLAVDEEGLERDHRAPGEPRQRQQQQAGEEQFASQRQATTRHHASQR
jgi:type II secretory pathway pseudopilin PulG